MDANGDLYGEKHALDGSGDHDGEISMLQMTMLIMLVWCTRKSAQMAQTRPSGIGPNLFETRPYS